MNGTPRPDRRFGHPGRIWPCLLIAVSLALNLWGITYGLPERYYPDEGRMVNHALAFGMGDLNPHYFNYPALGMYLLFALYGAFFTVGRVAGLFQSAADFQLLFFSNPTAFYLIGRAANALAGAGVVALVYKLGKEAFHDRKIGLLSGAIVATLSYFVFYTHFIVTDILQLLFILGGYIFIVRISRNGRTKDYLWAGALTGLGIATKYSPVLLFAPLLLAHVFYLSRASGKIGLSRVALPIALAGLAMSLLFFIGAPYCFIDYTSFLRSLQFRSLLGEVHTFGTGSGSAWLIYPRLLFRHPYLLLGGLDLTGFIFLGGILWAAWKREKEDFLLLAYPLLLYLMMGKWSFGSNRYSLPLVIFLALWGARAIVEAARAIPHLMGSERGKRWAVGLLGGFIALAIALSLLNSAFMSYRLTRKDTRTLAKEWVETNIPPGTAIAVEWDTEATVQLWETPDDIRAKIAAYETGKAVTIHHASEQMAAVHRMRLAAVPRENYRIVRIGGMDGTRVLLDNYSIEELKEKGAEYLIVSDEVRRIFVERQGEKVYPRHNLFYRQVEEELHPVASFRPSPLSSLGPEINIYRL